MASQKPDFNLQFLDESSDDETIFITQTSREDAGGDDVNELDQSVAELDIESLMNSS